MIRLLIAVAASLLAMAAFAQSTPQAFIQKAKARTGYGDYQGAIADLSKAISMEATYVPAYVERGIVRQQSGDQKGALVDFDMAIAIDPS